MDINIKDLVRQYNVLSTQLKSMSDRKTELGNKIKEYSQKNGVKDDKGSYYIEDTDFLYGSVVKKQVKLNTDKAETFLKSKKLWKDVIVIKEEIDENKLETLVAEDKITLQELEDMTDIKTSYSVTVKPKDSNEEIPEVQAINNSVRKRNPFRRLGK